MKHSDNPFKSFLKLPAVKNFIAMAVSVIAVLAGLLYFAFSPETESEAKMRIEQEQHSPEGLFDREDLREIEAIEEEIGHLIRQGRVSKAILLYEELVDQYGTDEEYTEARIIILRIHDAQLDLETSEPGSVEHKAAKKILVKCLNRMKLHIRKVKLRYSHS